MRGRALTVRPFLLLLTSEMKYADVILPLPLENSYTYSIPTDLEAAVTPGCRVIVHFGKKRYYTAIVMEVHERRPNTDFETKEIYAMSSIPQNHSDEKALVDCVKRFFSKHHVGKFLARCTQAPHLKSLVVCIRGFCRITLHHRCSQRIRLWFQQIYHSEVQNESLFSQKDSSAQEKQVSLYA